MRAQIRDYSSCVKYLKNHYIPMNLSVTAEFIHCRSEHIIVLKCMILQFYVSNDTNTHPV